MNIDSFTDEQLLNLVNNTITRKTEFQPDDFTGGSVIITSTHSNRVKNFRVSLYFGYKGKHPINRQIEISKDLYFIWAKAIMLKIFAIDSQNVGMDIDELNSLMNSKQKETKRNKVDSNSSIVDSSIVDSRKYGDTPVPPPVPVSETMQASTRIAKYLLKKIKAGKPNFKKPNLSTWAKDIDKAIRIDKRSEHELIGCIDWIYTQEGSFWIPNIQSGKKLREKFDTMEAQKVRGGTDAISKNLQMMEDIINAG